MKRINFLKLSRNIKTIILSLDDHVMSSSEHCEKIQRYFKSTYGLNIKAGYRADGERYRDYFFEMDNKTFTLFQLLL